MSFKVLAVVLCISVSFQGTLGFGGCEEWEHHTYGKGITCCKHKSIHTGINENTHWDECTKHPKNEKEAYTTSVWRVYTCVLEKSLPKGAKTICFTKFAELMTGPYPEDIKKEIMDKVKETVKNEKSKKWLTTDIKLTDHENIDKLRADYFNIEKKLCGGTTPIPKGEEKGKPWKSCNYTEEILHRDADCCLNTTVPMVDHHHTHFQDFKSKNCEKTLKKKIDKLGLKDKGDIATFVDECRFSCFLIEKKFITIDQLLKLRVKDEVPTDKIVKDFLPNYVSAAVLKQMQTYVKTHLNRTAIMTDVPNTMLGDKANHDELYACYAFATLNDLITHTMFEICHPNFPHEDPDYA